MSRLNVEIKQMFWSFYCIENTALDIGWGHEAE